MFNILKRMTHSTSISCCTQMGTSYELFYRSGITLEQLDKLSFIHVAGTKGKGSTCAIMEIILRHQGFSTGFFSSPHLVSVRERIRINGEPISQSYFAHSFWKVYRRLEQNREDESDMPTYFKFLTILMFHVFLEANVDVAIVEVGIGGELDCTNILRNPVCVGVTSLGLEHTLLLGNTLEKIAQQKSGIFKPNAVAFTVPQAESAMCVLQKRAIERCCRSLKIVSTTQNQEWNKIFSSVGMITDVQQLNASLSIHMALEWMKSRYNKQSSLIMDNRCIDTSFSSEHQNDKNELFKEKESIFLEKVAVALANYKWPGRAQILKTSTADFFLDGAHTVESIVHCISWFKKTSRNSSRKYLIFNTTGNRDSLKLLKLLVPLDFDRAYFTPNYAGVAHVENLLNCSKLINNQEKKYKEHCEQWGKGSVLKNSVAEVLDDIKSYALSQTDDKVEVLVTGSLHLVGALLTILDPNLTMTSDF
ncbi:folylpolyglutamate synthase, mitochondrial isoform X2 [Odontomachus brunneus]|uniref:folylpolyglutamate synthase, mitochondrial isoform X2 n=1 Tax=Odontomachus brunneus TaxID=486640 RepID=UPI0013F20A34|nr:folylpolyglutamate synthase, mitochondrial isoform X2 [Odontomachus brunneus]